MKHQIYIPRHIDTNPVIPIMFCNRNTNPAIPKLYATLSEREGCTAWTPGEAWCRIAGDSIFSVFSVFGGWCLMAGYTNYFAWKFLPIDLVSFVALCVFWCLLMVANRGKFSSQVLSILCPLCFLVFRRQFSSQVSSPLLPPSVRRLLLPRPVPVKLLAGG